MWPIRRRVEGCERPGCNLVEVIRGCHWRAMADLPEVKHPSEHVLGRAQPKASSGPRVYMSAKEVRGPEAEGRREGWRQQRP